MRYTGLLIATILLSTLLAPIMVESAFRKQYDIEVKGNTYILDLYMVLEKLDEYGVVSIYLMPEGGYAYGLTILKDPDEPSPHIYLMLGLQHQWFDLGLLNTTMIRFRLIIDRNSSKALLVMQDSSRVYSNLSKIPVLEKLHISDFNITGRDKDYPSIYISFLHVYVSNKTIDELEDIAKDLTKSFNETIALSLEDYGLNIKVSTTSSPIFVGGNGLDNTTLIIALITIAVIGVSAIIFIVNYMGRTRRGSPGP